MRKPYREQPYYVPGYHDPHDCGPHIVNLAQALYLVVRYANRGEWKKALWWLEFSTVTIKHGDYDG